MERGIWYNQRKSGGESMETVVRAAELIASDISMFMMTLLLLVFNDWMAVSEGRRLLHDFLIGAGNRQSAARRRAQQSARDRVLMGYVRQYLKRWKQEFDRFHRLYLLHLMSLIPQYALVFLLTAFGAIGGYFMMLCIVMKVSLNWYYRLQFNGLRISKYRNGRK